MTDELRRWAKDSLPLVAREIEARVGRPHAAMRSAEWVMIDCLCAFDALEAGGAGLAAFGEIVAFVQGAHLPWPSALVEHAMRQDLVALGGSAAAGQSGFADGVAAIRTRVIDHIRAVAVSDVLQNDDRNRHMSSQDTRERFWKDFGRTQGEDLFQRITAENPLASNQNRAAAAIAFEQLNAARHPDARRGFPDVATSAEAVYRSAIQVWAVLGTRVDPDGDLSKALDMLGRLSPGAYYVPQAATLARLGLLDLTGFPGSWIRPSGPHLPSRNA